MVGGIARAGSRQERASEALWHRQRREVVENSQSVSRSRRRRPLCAAFALHTIDMTIGVGFGLHKAQSPSNSPASLSIDCLRGCLGRSKPLQRGDQSWSEAHAHVSISSSRRQSSS